MSGSCKQGFSFIEVLMTVTIIALIGTVVVPIMLRKDPREERRLFLTQLNGLIGFGQQQAIITGKEQKVEFNFPIIRLLAASDKRSSEGTVVYEPIKGAAITTEMTMPKHLEIKQFLLEGKNEMDRFLGASAKTVWFFVMPNGIAQAIIINVVDKKDGKAEGKGRQIGWVLNPFSAQFKEYDEFQS